MSVDSGNVKLSHYFEGKNLLLRMNSPAGRRNVVDRRLVVHIAAAVRAAWRRTASNGKLLGQQLHHAENPVFSIGNREIPLLWHEKQVMEQASGRAQQQNFPNIDDDRDSDQKQRNIRDYGQNAGE